MNMLSRSELSRLMLAQLNANQRAGQVNAETVVRAFVEQLIAQRDFYEREVANLRATCEAELAITRRELSDLNAEQDDLRSKLSAFTERKPSNVQTLRPIK